MSICSRRNRDYDRQNDDVRVVNRCQGEEQNECSGCRAREKNAVDGKETREINVCSGEHPAMGDDVGEMISVTGDGACILWTSQISCARKRFLD